MLGSGISELRQTPPPKAHHAEYARSEQSKARRLRSRCKGRDLSRHKLILREVSEAILDVCHEARVRAGKGRAAQGNAVSWNAIARNLEIQNLGSGVGRLRDPRDKGVLRDARTVSNIERPYLGAVAHNRVQRCGKVSGNKGDVSGQDRTGRKRPRNSHHALGMGNNGSEGKERSSKQRQTHGDLQRRCAFTLPGFLVQGTKPWSHTQIGREQLPFRRR